MISTESSGLRARRQRAQPAVVQIYSRFRWCGPCRMIAPMMEELSSEYAGKALVGEVDVDDNPEISMKYGIRSIPTILILKNGEVVEKHVGTITEQALTDKIEGFL